ncbi:MAG: GNAT family N-acetyltransferase [Alphaproteobacteria bacterium]|nr:GNAT family N-acetyltransferase [Alphaproteobacteria bacterium]
MSEINKPEQIIVDKLTLKQVPAQQEYAQQIFNAFHEDEPSFKFWMEDGIYKTVQDVLNAYKTKYNDEERWKYAMYGIFKGNELLGEIGLSCIDTKFQTAEIGYWLKKSARGQGLIDKLIPAIEKLGFENLNLRKITIWCDTENIASRRHAEKNNYILEGIQRERKIWPDGSIHSTAMYGKLKSEYKK